MQVRRGSRASESCASPFALYRATRNSWLGQAIRNTMASPPRKTGNQEINGWAQSNPWMGNDHIEFYPLRTMLELKCWRSQCFLAAKDRIVGDQHDHFRLGSQQDRIVALPHCCRTTKLHAICRQRRVVDDGKGTFAAKDRILGDQKELLPAMINDRIVCDPRAAKHRIVIVGGDQNSLLPLISRCIARSSNCLDRWRPK